MKSIWKENYDIMKQLNAYTTTYITFVENGGHPGDFPDSIINKSISLYVKLKSNRDAFSQLMNYDIPTEKDECLLADAILNGTYKQDRLFDVIERIYTH